MPIGTGVNCAACPDYKNMCAGDATDCLCRLCPRSLGQCMCVKYCRETESILTFEKNNDQIDRQIQTYWDEYRD